VRWFLALPFGLLACSSSDDAPAGPPPTFSKDVAPLLFTNCALAACHASKESPQSFHVTYDAEQVYAELGKNSPTCTSWRFVTPGKPEESLLMLKMDGEQGKLPTECVSARRSEMPPGDPPRSNSDLLPKADRDRVRAWIRAGAKKD